MTWAEEVRNAVAALGIPCVQGEWEGGGEPRYMVFDGILIPDGYADDEPRYERVLIQLHLFAPAGDNTMALRKDIKLALKEAGFSYPSELSVSEGGLQREPGVQHIVFEFEGVQVI